MVQQIAQIFTAIAILIALMGLYGLVLITLNRKTKEIAVRKVLGADLSSIVMLLGRNFLWLICLAICLSIPISYWSMDSWLSGYAYQNGFEWPVLLVAGITLLLISVLTIYWQTRKVSEGNPADSLKYE